MNKTTWAGFIILSFLGGIIGSSRTTDAQEDTITLTHWDGLGAQSLAFNEAIQIFEERHPNIKIERLASPTAAEDILLALEFGSSEPDVLGIISHPEVLKMMDMGNTLVYLNEFPDFEEFTATIPDMGGAPLFIDGVNVFNGGVVSLPFERYLPLWHLFVNTALYREAGIVDENGEPLLPKTLDDFFQNSLTIYQKTGAYGFSSDSETFDNFLQLCVLSIQEMEVGLFGYKPYLARSNWAGEPCYTELFEGFQMLWDAGAIPKDHMEQNFRVMRERFVGGEIAHIIDGIWAVTSYANIDLTFDDYTLVQKPLARGLEEPINFEGRASIVSSLFLGINAQSEHPEEAWEWIKFIHSAEFAEIWLKYEFGVSIYLETDPNELDLSPIFRNYVAQSDLIRMASPLELPDIQFYPQLFGPTHLDITKGILSGEIRDFQAAMEDYDRRLQDAFDLAFMENQEVGIDISPETYTSQNYRWLDAVPLFPQGQ